MRRVVNRRLSLAWPGILALLLAVGCGEEEVGPGTDMSIPDTPAAGGANAASPTIGESPMDVESTPAMMAAGQGSNPGMTTAGGLGPMVGGPSASGSMDQGSTTSGVMATGGSDSAATMTATTDADTDGAVGGMTPADLPGQPGQANHILPPVMSTDADGPFAVTIDEGSEHWVFRPEELGAEGLKHPVFVWGTGSTAVPSQYTDHFSRMASHGFVIVAPTPSQLNAGLMTAALEWILAENERTGGPYYQMLDPDRVAMGGHSQGSTSTFDAEANETRLKTTIHVAGGSFDGRGSSKVKTPTAYICGETDFALSNCQRDFETVEDQPTFFSVLEGVDHIQCAREALPGMIAWLRWHLAGETERAADFTGPAGEFFQGKWGSETKNWSF